MSFEFEISDSDRIRAEVISAVGADLQALYLKRKHDEGLTQQKIAETLDIDKSRVNRCLTGYANLTLGTVADLSRAIKGKILIKIIPEEEASRWALHYTGSPNVTSGNATIMQSQQTVSTGAKQIASGTWR